MDAVTACLIIEGCEEDVSEERLISAYQYLIDCGIVWQLQGSYGRTAKNLIDDGICHYA